jgi:hypothetical protein
MPAPWEHAVAFLVFGVMVGPIWRAADCWLRNRAVTTRLRLLCSLGSITLIGYIAFWAYFVSPVAGTGFVAVLWTAAVVYAFKSKTPAIAPRADDGPDADGELEKAAVELMLFIGVFYLGLLHLYGEQSDIDDLVRGSFLPNMPGDNRIPRLFAERLLDGVSPKNLVGDWLSSDRPPLQTGVVLLFAPLATLLRFSREAFAHAAGLWFQLLWVPATLVALRSIDVSLARARVMVLSFAAMAFCFSQSVYVWPKLGGGALALAAFLVYAQGGRTRLDFALIGMLAGLAWLSHGGTAFSVLALALLMACSWKRIQWNTALTTAGVFALLVVPWMLYQRCYEPPGDRLLKWHLAGVVPIDSRTFGETLVQQYRALTLPEILRLKWQNFVYIYQAPYHLCWQFGYSGAEVRRMCQAFIFSMSLGAWFLAVPLIPFYALRPRFQPAYARLAGWVLLSFALWLLLMFGSLREAVTAVHQGSYAVVLGLLVMCAGAALRFSSIFCGAIVAYNLLQFSTSWVAGAGSGRHEVSWAAVCVMGGAVLAYFVGLARKRALAQIPIPG